MFENFDTLMCRMEITISYTLFQNKHRHTGRSGGPLTGQQVKIRHMVLMTLINGLRCEHCRNDDAFLLEKSVCQVRLDLYDLKINLSILFSIQHF